MVTCKRQNQRSKNGILHFRTFGLIITAFVSLAAISPQVQAATYYLDANNGNDSNAGTSGAPWKTISRALPTSEQSPRVQAGDIVEVRTGEYGAFNLTDYSGSNWITYRAAEGHSPRFTSAHFSNTTQANMYVRLDGFTVAHKAPGTMPADDGTRHYSVLGNVFSASNSNYLEIRNCVLQGFNKYISLSGAQVTSCSNVTFYHNDLSVAVRGFMVSSSPNFRCRYNYVHDTSEGSGIRLNGGCQGSLIEGNHVTGQYGSADDPYFPENDTTVWHPGSGISIRSDALTIRNNIVHDGYSQGMMFYLDAGIAYSDMTIENNLFYDTGRVYLYNCGDNVLVRNNTFIGSIRKDGTGKYDIFQRYDVIAFGMSIHDDYDGDGVELYNNIVVSPWYLPDSTLAYKEDYNTFWRRGYVSYGKGAHTVMAVWRTDDTGYPMHGNPNYFENIGYTGSTAEYSHARTGDQPHFVNPGMYTHKDGDSRDSGKIWDYHLADGSPSINRGSAAHQPDDSLGTLGADGFIREDGVPRDASHHSVGCYEYSGSSTPANHAPTLSAIGTKTVNTNSALVFSVTATDSDGDSLTYTASPLSTIGATFAGQTFSWTPTSNQAGTYNITFTVSDGRALDSETVTITVQQDAGSNAAPVLGSIGNKSTSERQTLSFSVSATDADGDALTYSANGLPSGASFSSQNFSWTPDYDQAGSHGVTFTVSDGRVQDSETIIITVTNVNQAPTLQSIGSRSTEEDERLTFNLSASDPDGDTVTYSASGLPSGATLSNGTFSWTPSASQVGTHSVTFAASDGNLEDTETASLTVTAGAPDESVPTISQTAPETDDIQVPLNNLITLHLTDTGKGVDADTVVIRVDGDTVYQGDTDAYTSSNGKCSRSGNKNNYKFIYQANDLLPFDHLASVSVDASDLAGNVMPTFSYSFATEMRAFGNNLVVSGGTSKKSQPATVADSSGNIVAVWASGSIGSRKIYASVMAAGATEFGASVQVTSDSADHCQPDIAMTDDGTLYTVWQDDRNGHWDIYASSSSDGQTWSPPVRITSSDSDETNPAIAVGAPPSNLACITWQDDQNSHWDIYASVSNTGLGNGTVTRVTSNGADQTEPDVAVNSDGTVYIVWTDMRNGQSDIYGASSEDVNWTNVPIVTTNSGQTNPVVAAEQDTAIVHLLWVDNAPGDDDVYYASSSGLPETPVVGSSIIDDTSNANQGQPSIVCLDNSKVFGCWQDWRHAARAGSDSDLFMADLASGSAVTNVFVGDDSTNSAQSQPAVGIDGYGNPYIVWTDGRGSVDQIYYAGTTFIDPVPLDSKLVKASEGATIGPDPSEIDEPTDVSIIVPAGACQCDVQITITEILNPQALPVECLGSYDFGPSGVEFDEPVTVTIPYRYTGGDAAKPYWYDSLTGALSQQGITDIKNLVISDTISALQFKTTHFTPFYLVAEDPVEAADDSSGGGGGCSVSATGSGSPVDMVVPYGIIAVVMVLLRRRDRQRSNVSRSV